MSSRSVLLVAVIFGVALVAAGCKKKSKKPAQAIPAGEAKKTEASETGEARPDPREAPAPSEVATETARPGTEATAPAEGAEAARPATETRPAAEGAPEGQPAAASPRCRKRFKSMDTNNDGRVSRKEFMAAPHRRKKPAIIFRARDANKDGHLTEGEFCAGGRRGRGLRGRRRRRGPRRAGM